MKSSLIFLMTILSLMSCQLYDFKDQFKLEVEKLKPKIKDKKLEKIIFKVASNYKVEMYHEIKIFDLNQASRVLHSSFEKNLVRSKNLPASKHEITEMLEMPFLEDESSWENFKNDKWKCKVAVAQKKGLNKVSLLVISLYIHVDVISFGEKAGVDLSNIDTEDLAKAIFYNHFLKIIKNERAQPKIYDFTKNIKNIKKY